MIKEKEVFVKSLKRFVASGFKEVLFTKPLYCRLSCCFNHIAHTSKADFYTHWFSDPEKQLRWLNRATSVKTFGDPDYCYVDAEREIQKWLREHPEYLVRAQALIQPTREQLLEAALQKIVALEYEDIHDAKEIATQALRP